MRRGRRLRCTGLRDGGSGLDCPPAWCDPACDGRGLAQGRRPSLTPGQRRRRRCLDRYAQPGDDGLVFTGPHGALLRRSNFRRRVWLPALEEAGLPETHFHDLRHTGNILTAAAGASLRELMARMGHTSTQAALVYLHDSDDRQRIIAAAVSNLAWKRLGQPTATPQTFPEERRGTARRHQALAGLAPPPPSPLSLAPPAHTTRPR